jgi:hypothetical protein
MVDILARNYYNVQTICINSIVTVNTPYRVFADVTLN